MWQFSCRGFYVKCAFTAAWLWGFYQKHKGDSNKKVAGSRLEKHSALQQHRQCVNPRVGALTPPHTCSVLSGVMSRDRASCAVNVSAVWMINVRRFILPYGPQNFVPPHLTCSACCSRGLGKNRSIEYIWAPFCSGSWARAFNMDCSDMHDWPDGMWLFED